MMNAQKLKTMKTTRRNFIFTAASSGLGAPADALVAEPVVLINSGGPENPIVMQRLFAP